MALALGKRQISLTRNQILAITGGVVLAAAAGWFGWHYFEEARPAPVAPSKPQPVTAAKPPGAGKAAAPADSAAAQDKLIEDVLVASGMNQQLTQLPQRLMAGVVQASQQKTKASPAVAKAIENAVAESFTAQGFHDRIRADLKKHFDQKRLRALLDELSTPAAKRMIELAQASPSPQEFARFSRSAAATRPSSERASLIKRIDAATRASDLALDVAFSSMKTVAMGIVGEGAQKTATVDKVIEKQRASATQEIRNATLLNLAFVYRNASDAELKEYAKICETENSKWFTDIVYASMLEEVKSASTKAGERIGELASKPGKSASPAAKPIRSKAGTDARTCLGLATNAAIIKCAEQYR